MPNFADWFVGGVAIVLGIVALVHALSASERVFELPKMRWLERRYGKKAAKIMLGVLGLILIALGAAIALGFKVNWSS
jgi:hypothetical protein